MIDLRILFVIGLVAMGLLVCLMVAGTFAAAGWLHRLGQRVLRRRGVVNPVTARPGWRTETSLRQADAERRLRARQAVWRLRC